MKYIFLFFSLFYFNFSISQDITFECGNSIVTVSLEEIANNPYAYMDWNGDGEIDESDVLIYLLQAYDCENNGEDDLSIVFVSLIADSQEINEIGFEIYDCDGNLYLQAGAPYEGYTELPNDFTIVMVDYSGDGWNDGSSIYIDGYGEYTLEEGFFDTISNCDNNSDDDNSNGSDNDWGDNIDCEEETLISVNGGAWMEEIYWTITTCDGQEIIAEGGAPYNNCISLPDNYVLNMYDSFGDGWNGNIMTIGDATFNLESCFENIVAVGDCNIDWWGGDDSDCENIDYWNDFIWDDSDWDNNGNGIDDFDWDNNGDGFDDFIWDDFDWSLVWDDYNLGDVDWENIPWDDIIDLFINPEDLINYLDDVIFRQLFNWNDFIEYFIENNSSLNLENNSSSRYIVKTVNIMGQNVNHNFDGLILYLYNDGSIERKYFIK